MNKPIFELQRDLTNIGPSIGSLWKHYKGGIYRVIMKAIEANEPYRIKIMYENKINGYIWEHSLDEWQKDITLEDGTIIKRFSLLENCELNVEEQWDC